ncbi:MAG: hypothetical protein ACD_49C00049G0025 [uncultured bacterium (gcode 4)]|uniref:Uncharacterized protein n=1 Tax=uncultured bacterium (gcode 4) TaxID=1234023 RepID=K2AX97_9BACT|nr:MAG: hypothetical protein ACD_49C00049G0025 [uncultured bacterium (gcode 4)]
MKKNPMYKFFSDDVILWDDFEIITSKNIPDEVNIIYKKIPINRFDINEIGEILDCNWVESKELIYVICRNKKWKFKFRTKIIKHSEAKTCKIELIWKKWKPICIDDVSYNKDNHYYELIHVIMYKNNNTYLILDISDIEYKYIINS